MVAAGQLVAFLPSRDLDRSARFFTEALGLELVDRSDFACLLRSGGTTLRVTWVPELTPHPFTVLGWDVPDVRAAVRELRARGVEPLRYDGFVQDDLAVWEAPSRTLVVWFHDPDGNVLSFEQHPG